VVGVQGFAGEISEAQRRESRKSNIGFTDFAYEVAEGSKSEIFRRCDAGASNENANKLTKEVSPENSHKKSRKY